MVRLSDWEARLNAHLTQMQGEVFAWGKTDCCMFAAGVVIAQTGVDPIPEFRGRYTTKMGAAKALIKYGNGDLESTIAAKFEDRPIGYARRGDLVMHDGAVGVCVGADAMFMGQEGDREGLVRIPRRDWQRAFAV
jgi:hypothetical protein